MMLNKILLLQDNIINILGLAEKRVDKGEMFYSKINSRYEIENVDSLFRKLENLMAYTTAENQK